jgi:hypothetical protein
MAFRTLVGLPLAGKERKINIVVESLAIATKLAIMWSRWQRELYGRITVSSARVKNEVIPNFFASPYGIYPTTVSGCGSARGPKISSTSVSGASGKNLLYRATSACVLMPFIPPGMPSPTKRRSGARSSFPLVSFKPVAFRCFAARFFAAGDVVSCGGANIRLSINFLSSLGSSSVSISMPYC